MSSSASPAPLESASGASLVDPSWVVRFRFGAFLSELVLVVLVDRFTDIALPVPLLTALLGYGVASNAALHRAARSRRALPEAVTGLVLGHDVVLLTGLLWVTGGVHNPFSTLYLAYLALAPLVLGGRWTTGLAVLAIGCFAALFVVSGGLLMKEGAVGVDHATQMRIHMRGMWLAFTVAAVLIGVFAVRVRRALDEQARALERVRARQARLDKLGAVATLAAGATHELGTPLATIAVVAKELERALSKRAAADAPLVEDAALIRAEVERCRAILERLAGDAGALKSGAVETVTVRRLLEEATRGLEPVALEVAEALLASELVLPTQALAMALRSLVKNGLDASRAQGTPVAVRVRSGAAGLVFEVQDLGEGMSPTRLKAATEPFFTTKAPGQGMGLGLFLAQAVAEQLDGRLELVSAEGRGTTASMHLPSGRASPAAGSAPA